MFNLGRGDAKGVHARVIRKDSPSLQILPILIFYDDIMNKVKTIILMFLNFIDAKSHVLRNDYLKLI